MAKAEVKIDTLSTAHEALKALISDVWEQFGIKINYIDVNWDTTPVRMGERPEQAQVLRRIRIESDSYKS